MADATLPHGDAVDDFVERVDAADLPEVQRLILFGSVAQTRHTADSDIDVLAVLDDDADVRVVEERLRDIAYDVLLERDVVISIHAMTESAFEGRSEHPFVQTVRSEGEIVYG